MLRFSPTTSETIPFVDLPSLGLTEKLAPFSIIPRSLELDLVKQGKIDLENLYTYVKLGHDTLRHYRRLVPKFSEHGFDDTNSLWGENRFEMIDLNFPCAMQLNNTQELEKHIGLAYQIANAHYVLGMKYGLKDGIFPYACCGYSSSNIAHSLISGGYFNAAIANAINDHEYVFLPFVLGKTQGSIIIDPTSDQLWNEGPTPRNVVFVELGTFWEYETHYSEGANLFPAAVGHLEKFSKYPFLRFDKFIDGIDFLETAFANPVKLPI
jgi:hypothetical protein